MTTTVSLSVAALTIDCADPAALADFWGKALGRPVSPGAVAGDTAVAAAGPDSGPRMILHNVPNPKGMHLVLITDHYDEEIERLTGLGATPLNQTKIPAVRAGDATFSVSQTTFADPEGNEFDLGDGSRSPSRCRVRALTDAPSMILDRRPPPPVTSGPRSPKPAGRSSHE